MLCLLLLALPLSVSAQNGVLSGLEQMESAAHDFQQLTLQNPVMRFYADDSLMTVVGVSGYSHPSSISRVPQLGTGGRNFSADAKSFQRLSKNDAVWGQAAYTNGRKYDVVWNETSDFLLLYPYVMADGRGGDLKYEQYDLSGGYTFTIHRHHLGLQMGYRALSEYRDRDPRPDNTTSDLFGRLGYGFDLGKYSLGASLLLGKYKQTNELKYYNELGAQKEYHLTGIGNDFVRFSGASNNTFYKGHNVGVSLDLMPRSAKGLSASIVYNHTKREKVMSDLNKLPLNDLYINNVEGELAWTRNSYGIKFHGGFAYRKGDDNIFGEPTGNLYPQLGTRHQYHGHEAKALLSGYWLLNSGHHWSWSVTPRVGFVSMHSRHNESDNQLNTDNAVYGLMLKGTWRDKLNRVSAFASIDGRSSTSHKLTLNNCSSESLAEALYHVDRYFSKNENALRLGMKYDRVVFGNKAISLSFDWRHGSYLSGEKDNAYTARLSFAF